MTWKSCKTSRLALSSFSMASLQFQAAKCSGFTASEKVHEVGVGMESKANVF